MGKSNGKQKETTEFDVEHELTAGDGNESSSNASGSAGSPAGDGAIGEADLQKLKAERDSLLDRLARAQAEFENARRRAAKEQQDFRDFASIEVIKSLLPVIDSFERALQSKSDAAEFRSGRRTHLQAVAGCAGEIGGASDFRQGRAIRSPCARSDRDGGDSRCGGP